MDVVDEAQKLQDEHLARSLAAARSAQRADGGLACLSCGQEIAPARRKALPRCCLCFACQEEFERAVRR